MSFSTRILLLIILLLLTVGSVHATIYYVTNVNDAGAGSLRQAMTNANGHAGLDSIYFNIPGAGPHRIQPVSVLPTVTSSVLIDGYTQTGALPATDASAATMKIEINRGTNAVTNPFYINTSNTCLRGLVVNGFNESPSGGAVRAYQATDLTIEGCYLGVDITGSVASPNYYGLEITNCSNIIIGGIGAARRNILSGNQFVGLYAQSVTGITVLGNYIGTDAAGSIRMGNENTGIQFANCPGVITIESNVIADSRFSGIQMQSNWPNADVVYIRKNKIGTDRTGTQNLGNRQNGITMGVNANRALIGGSDAQDANIIAFNQWDGVKIWMDNAGMKVIGNSIHSNGLLGIDLTPSFSDTEGKVTLNDSDDADTGPNNLQNFPVITLVQSDGSKTRIQGTLNSAAHQSYDLEFFRNATADVSGYGEGEFLITSTSVQTDASGNADFDLLAPFGSSLGNAISATATDANGNTSEFCESFVLTAASIVSALADHPLMDIRMRRLGNVCLGDSSLLDLAFDVRTLDGTSRSIKQIQDAVLFTAALGNNVQYVRALSWALPAADYTNLVEWTATERVLEFRSTHLDGHGYTLLGGPTLTDWHNVAVFRVVYSSQAGQSGDINWYSGTPNYNVSVLQSPDPGIETIQNEELADVENLPLECAADLALAQPAGYYSVHQTQTMTLTYIIHDLGGSDSRQIIVSDSLPAGDFQFVSYTASHGNYDWDTHQWMVTEISAGSSDTLRLTIQAMVPGLYDVAVKRTASQPGDSDPANDRVVTMLEILPGADVEITLAAGPNPVWQGKLDTLYYQLVNNGPKTQAEGIVVQVELANGFTYISHNDPLAGGENSTNFDPDTGVWNVGSLSTSVLRSLCVVVRANSVGDQVCRGHISSSGSFDHVSANDSTQATITVLASAKLYMRLYLEGPFRLSRTDASGIDTTFMACKLRYNPRDNDHSLLPVQSPYADQRLAGVADADGLPADIVDWLYVQVRPADGNGYAAEIMLDNGHTGMSCFLRKDGALVNIDGEEGLLIPALPMASYYVIISHRNHLRVMTSTAVNAETLTGYNWGEPVKRYYDFTESKERFFTKAHNNQRGCHLRPVDGKWLVAAGDGDEGRQVENQDWDLWFRADGMAIGYLQTDFDLGGQVEGRDETLWYDNLFVRSPFSWDMRQP